MTLPDSVPASAARAARDTGHCTLPRYTLPGRFLRRKTLFMVLVGALLTRVAFAALVGRTFDYDEFVILQLSRDYAHGLVPYADFTFFHPPGVLEVYRALIPVTNLWWPLGRVLPILADTGTTALVWQLARNLYGEREALAAALLYAVSPLALVSAVRVEQDSLLTFLGVLGLTLLVSRRSGGWAVVAGMCLTLALWMKLPAGLFGIVYLVAAPRRVVHWAGGAVLMALPLLFSVLPEWHRFYFDVVTFQRARWLMAFNVRTETTLIYWLGMNILALPGLFRRSPFWLRAGFLVGGLFILSSQVYYHYFVPIVPFAAVLAAPTAVRLVRSLHLLAVAGGTLVVLWAGVIDLGGSSPLYITSAKVSALDPAVHLLTSRTPSRMPVLADQMEYAYLAGRPDALHYFWNIGVLVNARYLERNLGRTGSIVLSYGASSGFPPGFQHYLNRHFQRVSLPNNTVWLKH